MKLAVQETFILNFASKERQPFWTVTNCQTLSHLLKKHMKNHENKPAANQDAAELRIGILGLFHQAHSVSTGVLSAP